MRYIPPSRKESAVMLLVAAVSLALTGIFIGLRPEHIFLWSLFCILFFASTYTRKLIVALLPFVLFAISYDWMRVYPNYRVNAIDVAGLYGAELQVFGVTVEGVRMTLCEYFAQHHCAVLDFMAGIFYLCWVPVPVLFGVMLYVQGCRELALRFALTFLLVNLIGFAGYYIHPAAPPWYVMEYGFEPLLGTPGNVAGLGRFDAMLGIDVFSPMYGRNANVFAAFPSLHSAYMPVAFFYALAGRCRKWLVALFAFIMVGIWFTAVYSGHHYMIDVLGGIVCAAVGILLFEQGLMRIPAFRRFFARYVAYVS